jgi:hypothetical protein
MPIGIRLGKIFNINSHVDWNWIFIFLLITWDVAGAVFPFIRPEWNAGGDDPPERYFALAAVAFRDDAWLKA